MTDPNEIRDTAQAAEKLRALQGDGLDPRVIELAHFVADRMNPEIVPAGFVMASRLALYDLVKGVDGFSGEQLESSLVGLTGLEQDEIVQKIPDLASVGFSEDFAANVKKEMIELKMLAPKEPPVGEALSNNEIITKPIDNIDDAMELIVKDAQRRVMALDWEHFGVTKEDVEKAFGAIYPLVLRNSQYNLPLNLLVNDSDEAAILRELYDNQKREILEGYWLAITILDEPIPPEFATFTRDLLFLKTPEAIAKSQGFEPGDVVEHFVRDRSGPSMRAAIRMHTLLEDYPTMLR